MIAEVVDASVLAALVFAEPRAKEAYTLLRGKRLYAPSLLPYELTSIARKKALRYPDQRHRLLRALDVALSVNIGWVEADHAVVCRLVLDARVSAYDACYLYVAKSLGLSLITFDERLRAAAGDES